MVHKMVLRRDFLKGYDIVRPQQFRVAVYASERFKTACEDAHCTGYSFREIELT
jgi:hypothetical protein